MTKPNMEEISKKEISGHQKASEDMRKLIQEVRIANPEINRKRRAIKQLLDEKYGNLFLHHKASNELWRYNFFLSQIHEMKQTILLTLKFQAITK